MQRSVLFYDYAVEFVGSFLVEMPRMIDHQNGTVTEILVP
jgi:hypothetical protein